MIENAAGCELRAAGRTLSGAGMVYGDVAPGFRERFEPGGLVGMADPFPLVIQHDRSLIIATTADTLQVTDGLKAFEARAELPADSAALVLVRSGSLRGMSVGFHAHQERRDSHGLRVVERYSYDHLGLVDRPAFPAATVEVRARNALARMNSYIPSDTALDCRCSGVCEQAEFMGRAVRDMLDEVFDEVARDIAREVAEAEVAQTAAGLAVAERADTGDVIACWQTFGNPLASVSRGTLRRDGPEGVTIDLPDDPHGRAVLDAVQSTGVVVRPHLDPGATEGEPSADGKTMRYTKARVRAFVVSATDARTGWPVPTLDTAPAEPRAADRRLLLL